MSNCYTKYYTNCDTCINEEQYKPKNLCKSVQPTKETGIIDLNNLRRACEFKPIKTPNINTCNKVSYISNDPRLRDPRRGGDVYPVSIPPLDGSQPFVPSDYRNNYNNYSDVRSGQINYYIDKSIENAYYNPVFVNNRKVNGQVYVDPMNNEKPHYYRQCKFFDESDGYNLSWLRDTQEQREDIIASQMAKNNQSRYEPLYYCNKK